jgi:zinc/manganese transport system substrate-binding protein
MRTRGSFVLTVALVLSAFAIGGARDVSAASLKVVTTTTVLKSLTEAVGGDKVQVTSIGTGREDPHFIQAKPSYMLEAHEADLWIRVGLELEIGYEAPIIDGARNPKIRIGQPGHLDASQGVLLLEVPTTRVTRAMGDVHPEGNPHYWLDPLNARIMAKTTADRLAELGPADSGAFAANLRQFQKHLDEHMFGKPLVEKYGGERLWALQLNGTFDDFLAREGQTAALGGWLGRMQPFKGKEIVIYHRSWDYFANRFGLVLADELEPKPGIPPTAAHLNDVIERMKADSIKLILVEPFYERKSADLVAAKTGARVVVCANCPGGQPEATDYLSLMDMVVGRVSEALKEN